MEYISTANRTQLEFNCLEDLIEKENPVRFIDVFVEKLELTKLHFVIQEIKSEGRPSFNPKVFLKLYFYGYLNGIRSSRRLEKECKRNIELHWLMGKLIPNYHSIADFRKENSLALRNTFKLFVSFLKDADLITGFKANKTVLMDLLNDITLAILLALRMVSRIYYPYTLHFKMGR